METNKWLEEIHAHTKCKVEKKVTGYNPDLTIYVSEEDKVEVPIRMPYTFRGTVWLPITGHRVLKRAHCCYTVYGGFHEVGSYESEYFSTVGRIDELLYEVSSSYGIRSLSRVLRVISVVSTLEPYIYPLPVNAKEISRYSAISHLLEDAIRFVNAEDFAEATEVNPLITLLSDCDFNKINPKDLYLHPCPTMRSLPVAFSASFEHGIERTVAMFGTGGDTMYATVETDNGLRTFTLNVPQIKKAYEEYCDWFSDQRGYLSIEDFCCKFQIYQLLAKYMLVYLGLSVNLPDNRAQCTSKNAYDLKITSIKTADLSDCTVTKDLNVKHGERWKITNGDAVNTLVEHVNDLV